jgi:hypothetical protein
MAAVHGVLNELLHAAVGDAECFLIRGSGCVHTAGGLQTVAAHERHLLDYDHIGAVLRRLCRRGQACTACAHDNYITLQRFVGARCCFAAACFGRFKRSHTQACFASKTFPYPVYVLFILGGACFAIATSLYGSIAQLRYPILSTIEDGWLPQVLASKTKTGYPYIVMGFMYLVAVVPILTGMTLDTLVSYMMIPNLVICMFNNLFFLKIPKQYPDAWKKSFLHMPYWLLVIVVAIAVGCDAMVIYNQFIYLSVQDQFIIVAMLAVIFAYCAVRLKIGKVNFKSLADAQAEIASLSDEKTVLDTLTDAPVTTVSLPDQVTPVTE